MDQPEPLIVEPRPVPLELPYTSERFEQATHGIRLRGDDHIAAPAAAQDPTATLGTTRLAA